MRRSIDVDEEVYSWLQSLATPFVDTPNSVLRRVAALDKTKESNVEAQMSRETEAAVSQQSDRHGRLARGHELIDLWKIPAIQARFRRDGTWYAPLSRFPAALCDCKGYLVFQTEDELRQSPGVKIHPSGQITAQNGISHITGYVKVDNPIRDPYGLDDFDF
jgi:hypothetical protein